MTYTLIIIFIHAVVWLLNVHTFDFPCTDLYHEHFRDRPIFHLKSNMLKISLLLYNTKNRTLENDLWMTRNTYLDDVIKTFFGGLFHVFRQNTQHKRLVRSLSPRNTEKMEFVCFL